MTLIKRYWFLLLAALLLMGCLAGLDAYLRYHDSALTGREAILSSMPPDATAVLFIDLAELRTTPFAAEFYKWIPQGSADADYAQFVRQTGFDYERDLQRAAIAVLKGQNHTQLFAVAEGRFNRPRIEAFAAQSGTRENRNGRELFTVPLNDS